ncbi:hypothetical protein BJ878DRAFT_487372 [Calycina marina]|uniref:Uncharacterized protein n=1 Tax=Calycina marina TaxID=1763456 RepID=A0A9P7ZAV3_9HELO|nr:hypothetical protein BJ878DRAFT_487372 [Calycina marina]
MDRTAAKLRKTFRYPTDSDSDSLLTEAMDEEEQENLIHTLQRQMLDQNLLYKKALIAIPLLCIIPYFTTLFSPHISLLSLLSITLLLSTSFLAYILPPGITSIPFLDSLNLPPENKSPRHQPQGPIEMYLPWLNIALGVMLGGLGIVSGEEGEWMGFAWLPGTVYAVTVAGKWIMGGVDVEGELSGLKYGFKGA